jgi:hypothetical protein
MSHFQNRLERLLATARERGVVGAEATDALIGLAKEAERERGVLHVTSVLGWLGGGIAVLGIILLVAAHWGGIPDGVKIGGFLVLLAGTHGVGLWIRKTGRPLEQTAEGFHFMGAGLFLAGVGLIAQIYNLNDRPPNAVLLWLVAIAPLAVFLRSGPITVMSIFALLMWAHVEGGFAGSPVEMPRYGFTAHLLIEIGVGAALVGFSGVLKDAEPRIAGAFRASGVLLLFYGAYFLGFYRHFSESGRDGTAVLPVVALLLGAAGLGVGWSHLVPESGWLRNRLVILLVALLAVSAAALSVDMGAFPRGPAFAFFNFGWNQHFDLAEWSLSVVAWAVWFLLALWCVAWGARSDRKAYVNVGVAGVGLGVVTRFFDLVGSMGQTGMLFLVGGAVLLGTGWAMERWRRKIVLRMRQGA